MSGESKREEYRAEVITTAVDTAATILALTPLAPVGAVLPLVRRLFTCKAEKACVRIARLLELLEAEGNDDEFTIHLDRIIEDEDFQAVVDDLISDREEEKAPYYARAFQAMKSEKMSPDERYELSVVLRNLSVRQIGILRSLYIYSRVGTVQTMSGIRTAQEVYKRARQFDMEQLERLGLVDGSIVGGVGGVGKSPLLSEGGKSLARTIFPESELGVESLGFTDLPRATVTTFSNLDSLPGSRYFSGSGPCGIFFRQLAEHKIVASRFGWAYIAERKALPLFLPMPCIFLITAEDSLPTRIVKVMESMPSEASRWMKIYWDANEDRYPEIPGQVRFVNHNTLNDVAKEVADWCLVAQRKAD